MSKPRAYDGINNGCASTNRCGICNRSCGSSCDKNFITTAVLLVLIPVAVLVVAMMVVVVVVI